MKKVNKKRHAVPSKKADVVWEAMSCLDETSRAVHRVLGKILCCTPEYVAAEDQLIDFLKSCNGASRSLLVLREASEKAAKYQK